MTRHITRLNRDGQGGKGLEAWGAFTSGGVLAGAPQESGFNFYEDSSGQFISGVWECTAGKVRMKDFASDEFCILLSGTVVITAEDGTVERFGAGDAFVIPKGFDGTWEMPETVRKFYVIFENKAASRQAAE